MGYLSHWALDEMRPEEANRVQESMHSKYLPQAGHLSQRRLGEMEPREASSVQERMQNAQQVSSTGKPSQPEGAGGLGA